jgi:hypothetical protein
MIQKLFGGKKKDYFLELEDTKSVKSSETTAESPKTEAATFETVKEEATAKPAKSSKKTAKKAPKAAPKAEPVVIAPPSQNNGQPEPQTAEFATKYLLVSTGSRRRPGPSLSPFKAMARDLKTPR